MHRNTSRCYWCVLWLLCLLPSLFHVSLGAPAQLEQPSDHAEPLSEESQAVMKQLEENSTVKNILKTLKSSPFLSEKMVQELSKVVLSYVLPKTERGQEGAIGQKGVIMSENEELLPETKEADDVTLRPEITRFGRQTTPGRTGLLLGGVINTSPFGSGISEAVAATKRWVEASKNVNSVTSTPEPEEEEDDDPVADATMSPNVPPTPAIDGEGIQQETTMPDDVSQRVMSSEPSIEKETTTTKVPEEFEDDGKSYSELFPASGTSDSEESDPNPDSFVDADFAVESPPSPDDSRTEDSEEPGAHERVHGEAMVTGAPTTELNKDAETETEETDYNIDEEEMPYGQDEANYYEPIPFNTQTKETTKVTQPAPTTTMPNAESAEDDTESFTRPTKYPIFGSTTISGGVPSEGPKENITESNQPEDEFPDTTQKPDDESTFAPVSDGSEDAEDNEQRANPSNDTVKLPAATAVPVPNSTPANAANTTAAAPSATTSTTELDPSYMEAGNAAATVSPALNRSSMLGQHTDTDPVPVGTEVVMKSSTVTPNVKPSPLPTFTASPTPKQPPAFSAKPRVMADPQGTLDSITRFQDPLSLLLISELGYGFANLTKIFRRPNLTDPLPDIADTMSEALRKVSLQHLRPLTEPNAVEEHDPLHLSVNGVRVDVNVSRKANFVQHGPTTVSHVDIDRRRMYVRLHLHFHNVSVPVNFTVEANLFPPFFSVKRPSGEAHVEVNEILVPLKVTLKLYFQKEEDEPSAIGILMPEDFVTLGASMLNVSTHFAGCGERDFMEKEVLRYDEHLRSGIELSLSHKGLPRLTGALRAHLLASRRAATMRLDRDVDEGRLIADAAAASRVNTAVAAPVEALGSDITTTMAADGSQEVLRPAEITPSDGSGEEMSYSVI